MGIQVAANASPVLKPHRLERAHLPQQTTSSSAETSTGVTGPVALSDTCRNPLDHDFVYGILSACARVTDYSKAGIQFEELRSDLRGFRLAGTVSPRGPPNTGP